MGKRRYPQLHSAWQWEDSHHSPHKQPPDPTPECECCERPAIGMVRVEWSYMRGEDDVYPVCGRHLQMANKQFDRYIAHLRTKEKFLSKKQA